MIKRILVPYTKQFGNNKRILSINNYNKQNKFYMVINNQIEFHELFQKEITENIAREVLNNSQYLVKEYQPFLPPEDESNGESDNIGRGFNIDTKLLIPQSVCSKTYYDDRYFFKNYMEKDFLYGIYESYISLNNRNKNQSSINNKSYKETQFEIINKIKKTLKVNCKKKNLLFIYPIPTYEFIESLIQSESGYIEINSTYSNSYMLNVIYMLSCIKKETHYSGELYLTYCLFNGEFALAKIEDNYSIIESFIECSSYQNYLNTYGYFSVDEQKNSHNLVEIRCAGEGHILAFRYF